MVVDTQALRIELQKSERARRAAEAERDEIETLNQKLQKENVGLIIQIDQFKVRVEQLKQNLNDAEEENQKLKSKLR